MEFLPSVPSVPLDQVAAPGGKIASESGNKATGSYDETFMVVLAGRPDPTPLQLPTLSELEGGEILPLDTHSTGNELPVDLASGKVEGVLSAPVSPLLSWPHINTATVGELDAEIPTRAGEARYLPTPRTSVPPAAYKQKAPVILDHHLPSNLQAGTSLAALQAPLLAEGRSGRQETVDAVTSTTVPSRADSVTQSLFANSGMGSLITLSANPSNNAFASEQVAHPFSQPGWGQAFGEKVLWLVNNNIRQAELRLNPPDLGPLEVRIAVDRDQASVLFASQHTLVRDAVEGTIPRLREMMVASGFTEVDVSVGQHWLGSQDQPAGRPDAAHHPSWVAGDDSQVDVSANLLQIQLGLVDLYV